MSKTHPPTPSGGFYRTAKTSARKIVRPLESIAETQPQVQPAMQEDKSDSESLDKKSERDLVCALIFFCHLLSAYTTESGFSSFTSVNLKLFFSRSRTDFRFRGLSSASIVCSFISSNPN